MAATFSAWEGVNGPSIAIVPSFSVIEPVHSKVLVNGPPTRSVSVQTWRNVPAGLPSSRRTASLWIARSPTDGPGLPVSTKTGWRSLLASTSRIVRSCELWDLAVVSAEAVPASARAATARAAPMVLRDMWDSLGRGVRGGVERGATWRGVRGSRSGRP